MTEFTSEQFDDCMRKIHEKSNQFGFTWQGSEFDEYCRNPTNLECIMQLAKKGFLKLRCYDDFPAAAQLTEAGMNYFNLREKDKMIRDELTTHQEELATQKRQLYIDTFLSVAAIIISIIALFVSIRK